MSTRQTIVGVGALVVLVAFFLPWIHQDLPAGAEEGLGISPDKSGFDLAKTAESATSGKDLRILFVTPVAALAILATLIPAVRAKLGGMTPILRLVFVAVGLAVLPATLPSEIKDYLPEPSYAYGLWVIVAAMIGIAVVAVLELLSDHKPRPPLASQPSPPIAPQPAMAATAEPDERVCPRCGSPAGEHPFCVECGLDLRSRGELPTRADWAAGTPQPPPPIAPQPAMAATAEPDERVCPRCGSPAGEHPFCVECGLDLRSRGELPTRADWAAGTPQPPPPIAPQPAMAATAEPDERVCPRCGSPAGEHPFCVECGLDLRSRGELPTRADWAAGRWMPPAQQEPLAHVTSSAAAPPPSAVPSPGPPSPGPTGLQRIMRPLPLVMAGVGLAVIAAVIVLVAGSGDDEAPPTETGAPPTETTAPPTETTAPAPGPAETPESTGAVGGIVTEEQLSQIAVGQTMDEVRALLGKPEATVSVGGRCWYWGLIKERGKPTAVEVCFDRNGIVERFGEFK